MVATRNKRKCSSSSAATDVSSSPTASAAAARSSKRGKSAAASSASPKPNGESNVNNDDDTDIEATRNEAPEVETGKNGVGTPTQEEQDEAATAAVDDDDDNNNAAPPAAGGGMCEDSGAAADDVQAATTDQQQQEKQQPESSSSSSNGNDDSKAQVIDGGKGEEDDDELNAASVSLDGITTANKEEEERFKEDCSISKEQTINDSNTSKKAENEPEETPADASSHVGAAAVAVTEHGKETIIAAKTTANPFISHHDKTNKSKNDKQHDNDDAITTSSKAITSSSTPSSTAIATTTTTAPTTTYITTSTSSSSILDEKDQLSPLHVGRVIGKGGEMIRDLQARSGCLRIDVDQNVPHNAPRIISYRGTRQAIDFAKQLVHMLCQTEQGKEANLPLGHAVVKNVHVPSNVIGKIIGRGGEMIRKLQGESMAKIQVDHTITTAGGDRLITITGVQESVSKAEEMIAFVCANPALDSMQGLDMFLRDKAQRQYHSHGGVGTGPSYHPPFPPYQQHQQQGHSDGGYYPTAPPVHSTPNIVETDMFPCPKTYMGRVIGQKGVTINDLQKRSGCDIQVNQNVPAGQDCEISIKGNRGGIEMAKQMLREIIEMGPNHPYAGGHGQGGGGFGPQGGGFGGGGGGYQQPYQAYPQQVSGYPPNDNYLSHQYQAVGGGPQHPFGTNIPPHLQQQSYGQPPYLLTPQHLQQPQQQHQQPSYHHPQLPPQSGMTMASPWRAATAPDGQIYYYNSITQETQWDKPAGMP